MPNRQAMNDVPAGTEDRARRADACARSGADRDVERRVLFIQGAGEGAHEEDALLVASLQRALGSTYRVRYPKMVNEDNPAYAAWEAQIAAELAGLGDGVVLVGHSVGGSILLKYLSEEQVDISIAAVILLAAPYWRADDYWDWREVRLPEDVAARLARIPRIVFYHSRDDEVVPFHHLALYAAKLPRAIVREVDGRGHQLANDLADVAEEITGISSGNRGSGM